MLHPLESKGFLSQPRFNLWHKACRVTQRTVKNARMKTGNEQRTLRRPATLEGIGLHSGRPATVRVCPAPPGAGLAFVRVDLPEEPVIPARVEWVVDTLLATTLGVGGVRVGTVEHLLAALAALQVDNARIEVSGPELPVLDGSSEPYVEALLEAGLKAQGVPRAVLVMLRPVEVRDGDKLARLEPGRGVEVACSIDFPHPAIGGQALSAQVDAAFFARQLAPARTFGFADEVEKLRRLGLAQGGSLANAVVLGDGGVLNPEGLRYPDEFVRHKVLDALGDLSLLGLPFEGRLVLNKPGHALNQRLVSAVLAAPDSHAVVRSHALAPSTAAA